MRRAGPIHSRGHLHDARDSRELLGGEWQRHLIETAQTSTGSFRFRCIRYLATISAVARANMQSPEAPTASSKIHSSTACMPGRKSELSMYGDLLQNAWELATEQVQRRITSAPSALERATHKVVAASAPQARVIQARQVARHRKKKGLDERGRPRRMLLSSGALADFVGNDLARP